jgi:hypothetical protein
MRALLALALLVPLVAGCLSAHSDKTPAAGGPDGSSMAALPKLKFLPPVDLVCPSEGISQVQNQAQGECGTFGEPVLEVAGDGAIWASATCCVGRSPPIWVSRDHGQTFQTLPFADRTGVTRDAFGIEGDFAIDDAGNVFFFDIAAATTYFSKYLADGTHVFTKPDAYPPLVDRPWVRAGVADEVWNLYNTGTNTNLYHSTNGGLTWSVLPLGFACGLMTFGQGPARSRLFVTGCSGAPQISISQDGGATFGAVVTLPVPDLGKKVADLPNGTGTDPFMPPSADEAGNIYVPFTYAADADNHKQGIWLDIVHPDGTIVGPILVSGDLGWNEKPWGGAGKDGHYGLAWYGSEATRGDGPNATWNLTVAVTTDGSSDAPHFTMAKPDAEPVLKGDFGRALGDFLQSDVGPDGRFYVIYAKRVDGPLQNRVVISDGLDLGPGVPHNGPKPA